MYFFHSFVLIVAYIELVKRRNILHIITYSTVRLYMLFCQWNVYVKDRKLKVST